MAAAVTAESKIEIKKDFTRVQRDIESSQKIHRESMSYAQGVIRTLKQNKVAMLSLAFIVFLILVAIFGPILFPDYQKQDLLHTLQKPSKEHLLGTDELGRDVLTRLIRGTRISLFIGFAAETINLIVGILYGGIAGFLGGKVDNVMMRIVDVVMSVPQTLVMILMLTVLHRGMGTLILSLTITGWVGLARLVRGQILSLRENEYAVAAKVLGAGKREILFHHLLPNTVGPIIVNYTMSIPGAIGAEAGMSYLGLGISVPEASWGNMLQFGASQFPATLWLFFAPAVLFALSMLAFNLLGDGLRDALDPRMRR
ncbi:MAG: ABC transporter permease [Lachnospiraceae bacterium]|nr:ABC transporter permease [Lachnospiraceae bacterium]